MGTFLSLVLSLLLTASVLWIDQAHARSPMAVDFSEFETSDFHIFSPEQCQAQYEQQKQEEETNPPFHNTILNELEAIKSEENLGQIGLLEWTPDATYHRAPSSDCRPAVLEQELLSNTSPNLSQKDALQGYFARCENQLRRFNPSGLWSLARMANTRYSFCQHPGIRKFITRLPDGNFLRGVIALKPGPTPRPLVIVRCGVACNAGDITHRFMLMHLFDESPFHVLAIASTTGADYVRDNKHMSLGGFEEGQQTIHLARRIRNGPLSSKVSSIHFIGVSLGAHGGLFASYLNSNLDHEFTGSSSRLLASSMALCPVVDLETSLQDLFQPPILGRIAKWVFLKEIFKVITSVPILRDIFPDRDPEHFRIPTLIADTAIEYYKRLPNDWALPPLADRPIVSREALWENNRFTSFARQSIDTPTLVLASDDDPIVSTRNNARSLLQVVNEVDNRSISVVTVPKGTHCAFNVVYGWPTISALLRSYILSHSPEAANRRTSHLASIPALKISAFEKIWPQEHHHLIRFRFEAGSPTLKVEMRLFSSYRMESRCWGEDPHSANEECFRSIHSKIRLKDIQGRPDWARIPETSTEAEAMTRWANTHLELLDSQGRPLTGTNHIGTQLRWVSF